jgi:hypothetical protein
MDSRAVSPVVGKLLEAGVVVIFVGVVLAGLQASAVPGFQAAAADELGDRTLAAGAEAVERAARTDASGTVGTGLDLPERIMGEPYRLRAAGDELVLEHPASEVGGRVPLALPANVSAEGSWASGGEARLSISNGTVELL